MADPHTYVAWPKINNLYTAIPEFDGKVENYIEWRNKLENIFTASGIMRVASFGRYSGNERDGYIKRAGNYQGTGADDTHHKAIFNSDNVNLKDSHNYPLEQAIDYGALAFDATATASAALMTPTFDRNTVNQTQVSFRELFDNQYISGELRLIHQQNFLKYKWTPDLSDGQSVQNFKAKYEKLKQLSNYQFANNFYQGKQAHLLDRVPLQYRTEVLFRQPKTYEEFFTYLNTTFYNKRALANERNHSTDSNQKDSKHKETTIEHHSEEGKENSKKEDLSEQITITDLITIIEDLVDKEQEMFNSEIIHEETTILETRGTTKEKGNNQKKNFYNKNVNHYQEDEGEEPQASTSNDQRKYYF
ncbi:831_t:CDS:2 [Ambispora leptoticha]|uniref:831_t:CDS:1 n=1 Tax=Ambispora leptoticha TaxID=144679 RepID=A0A9N9I0Q8_9GLOM|nr:831_t:CDS:2 [Ambispora leptoticha]